MRTLLPFLLILFACSSPNEPSKTNFFELTAQSEIGFAKSARLQIQVESNGNAYVEFLDLGNHDLPRETKIITDIAIIKYTGELRSLLVIYSPSSSACNDIILAFDSESDTISKGESILIEF